MVHNYEDPLNNIPIKEKNKIDARWIKSGVSFVAPIAALTIYDKFLKPHKNEGIRDKKLEA